MNELNPRNNSEYKYTLKIPKTPRFIFFITLIKNFLSIPIHKS